MHDQYHVLAGPPMSPPEAPPELLKALAAALNAVGTPVADALDEVTLDALQLAFHSISPRDRQVLLRQVGIKLAAPRRASKSLCRDVLTRLRRDARQHSCVCATKVLTQRVMDDVLGAAWCEDGEVAADPVARWSEALARAAIFSWCQASTLDAGLFVWAADRNWLGLGTSTPQLAAVRTAAIALLDATADFSPHSATVAETLRRTPSAVLPQTRQATEEPASTGSAVDAAYGQLEASLSAAREAVGRIIDALDAGEPPEEDDLLALSALAPLFTDLQQALAAVGITDVPRRLDDLARAVEAHGEARNRDLAARERLRTLLTVACAEGSVGEPALARAHDRANQLLGRTAWDDTDRALAASLAMLVDIAELAGQADDLSRIMELQQRIGQDLPDCLHAAVMYQHLSFTHHDTDTTAEEGHSGREETLLHAVRAGAGEADRLEPVPVPVPDEPQDTPQDTASDDNPSAEACDGSPCAESDLPEEAVDVAPGTGQPLAEAHAPGDEPAPQTGRAPEEADETPAAGPAPAVVEKELTRLVAEGRFGLAAHLSRAAGRSGSEAAALRLAAAAAVLRPGHNGAARAVAEALQQWDLLESRDAEGFEFLLLPALVRAALVTGEHVTAAQLKALAPRLPENLAAVAIAVGDRALNNALLLAPPMAVIADVSESEARLHEITEQCRALLKPPRLRFNRATKIAARWLAADGLLGGMLRDIVAGRPGAGASAREAVERLGRLSEVQSEIDRLDREERGSSGRALQGSGRQDLVHLVERVVDHVKTWLDVTETLRRGETAENEWAVRAIAAMRQEVLALQAGALADLDAATGRSGLPAAAAKAAREALVVLFHELDHGAAAHWPAPELDARVVIDAELLKVPVSGGGRPSLPDLLAAVDRTWDEALELQQGQDAFHAAHRILDLADWGVLPHAGAVCFGVERRSALEEIEGRRRVELAERHDQLVAELRRAQADGALSDDQDVKLQELLADACPTAEDGTPRVLSTVRHMLEEVERLLPRYRKEAADRLRARLAALPDITADERAQVLRHLDTGGFATAADLVYFLELGEPVPEIEADESHLGGFYPAVPAGLSEGVTTELIGLVRDRQKHPVLPALDYTHLSADEAARAADALARWKELADTAPKERQNRNVRTMLLPALQLLGYEAQRALPLHDLPRSNEYRFVEVVDIEVNGRAWVPAFGTKLLEHGGRLRVLMLWGRPGARLLLSRVLKEPSRGSLLVAYFGTLGRETREELATLSDGSLMVVDDAALAYLAAHGNRQVSVATEILLPFSGVNPYIKEKRGGIGREMFYGRDAERKSILDPDGTQIIFGGRGLGKSALLNDAGGRFAEQERGYHIPVYLDLNRYNIGTGNALGPETIWSVLDQELTEREVLAPPHRRKVQTADPYERVRSGVKDWLDADPRRRLLILMDECDRFFEADVPHCTQTQRLKGLCTDNRNRLKVVFAGLHSVQRFTRLARNGPFRHLAQTPTVVGPLRPQYAADLLVLPMRALGFEFADVDLVNRVLGYCSYQPFLLQMFGSRLVEVMQRKRARGDLAGPPFPIEAAEVEAVESDPWLREGITKAFKETLDLDDRYRVIANVLAWYAREYGLETRLSDVELRDECAGWWHEGFKQLDSEGFRTYLQEMVGLGVLAPNHDGRGWHLRGPNALRMIGTNQEVETQLQSAESECRLEETVVLEGRPEVRDGKVAPLTVAQVDDLLGDHSNQTRVVLGTPATGIGDVAETLRTVTGRMSGWTMPPVKSIRDFRQDLTAGRPGERRVVVSDLADKEVNDDNCRESLALAQNLLPERPGVTRAVVLVAGPRQLGLCRDLLTDDDTAASLLVVLRRHDRHSLKTWSQRSGLFDSDERLTRILEVTGGWPVLLDRAVALHRTCKDEAEALRRLADELESTGPAARFVDASGINADPLIATGYRAVAKELNGDWADEGVLLTAMELHGLEEEEARWACSCLEAFQALDRDGCRLRLEPVLYRCWARP
ncbi:hypothetical protein GCM10010218_04380 [Streptomyces mashuensis]|uniref:AAA domain-containing protein n=1 Tax=Streptomyces mashuensis TaxID=33904 RepID=A0A919AW55_9ACTN|nr:hypothetical protein [Streptomyces mashuensis]GHF26614.1 hypothetical protein GCM10010218_04380 [Streptomyces mashuensis]